MILLADIWELPKTLDGLLWFVIIGLIAVVMMQLRWAEAKREKEEAKRLEDEKAEKVATAKWREQIDDAIESLRKWTVDHGLMDVTHHGELGSELATIKTQLTMLLNRSS